MWGAQLEGSAAAPAKAAAPRAHLRRSLWLQITPSHCSVLHDHEHPSSWVRQVPALLLHVVSGTWPGAAVAAGQRAGRGLPHRLPSGPWRAVLS